MRPLHAIFVCLLCLASVGSVWASDPTATTIFADAPVTAFEVPGVDGPISLLAKGDRWWVTGPDGRSRLAKDSAVAALKSTLLAMHSARSLGRNGAPKSTAFDHITPVKWGDQVAEYGAGSRIPGLVYVRLPDGSVHLSRPLPSFPKVASLVDRRLFPDGLFVVDSINLDGPRGVVHATKKFGVWRLTVPDPSTANGAAVEGWLALLASVSGDPLAEKQGFTPITGGTLTTLSGADGESLKLTLRGDGRIALAGDHYQLDPLNTPLVPRRFDWMQHHLLQVSAEQVTGLQVRQGEVLRSFSLETNGRWREKSSGKVYRSWVSDLFSLLAPLKAVGLWQADLEVLGEAQRELRLWQGDTILATVELWRDGDDRWWARGGETVFVYEIDPALATHLGRLF